MKTNFIVAVLAVFAISLLHAGCGIDKDVHNQTLRELSNAQATAQIKQEELDQCNKNLQQTEAELGNVKGDLEKLGAKYENLGEAHNELDATYAEVSEQLNRLRRANELRQKALDELLANFAALIKSGKLTIGVNDGRMVIQLPSNLLFDVGSARLSKDGKEAIKEVTEVLKSIDQRKFQVAGHTDDQRAPGRINQNWTLSYKRARAVFDLMVKEGIDEAKLSLAAYAEYSPVASNETKEGRQKNRRIEIVLLPTSEELPLKQLKQIEKMEEKIEATK